MNDLARALIRRCSRVEGRAARLVLWAEAVRRGPAPEVARALDHLVRRAAAGDPEATVAYLPLLDLPSLCTLARPGALAAVLLAARARGHEGCLFLLEHPGAPRVSPEIGPPPDPVSEKLTLGHLKTAARGPRSILLERILRDSDPRVVGELLRNPRLREAEVLAIASRRPCPEEIFWLLVRSERIRSPAVRRAVAFNPHAPPRLASAILVTLGEPALRSVAGDERLHPAVRDGALQVLSWRRGEARPKP